MPKMLIAAATASSKKLLATINAEGPAMQCGTLKKYVSAQATVAFGTT